MTSTWLLTAATRGIGAWMTLFAVASFLASDDRIPSTPIDDLAPMIGLSAHVMLGLLFLVPGLGCLLGRVIRTALLVSVIWLSTFTVGLIQTLIFGQGTATIPVTYAFITLFVAFVLGQHQHISNGADR